MTTFAGRAACVLAGALAGVLTCLGLLIWGGVLPPKADFPSAESSPVTQEALAGMWRVRQAVIGGAPPNVRASNMFRARARWWLKAGGGADINGEEADWSYDAGDQRLVVRWKQAKRGDSTWLVKRRGEDILLLDVRKPDADADVEILLAREK